MPVCVSMCGKYVLVLQVDGPHDVYSILPLCDDVAMVIWSSFRSGSLLCVFVLHNDILEDRSFDFNVFVF